MILELSPEQRQVLVELVEREIAELGPEIRHTSVRVYREDLKDHKRLLRDLCEHLREPQAI